MGFFSDEKKEELFDKNGNYDWDAFWDRFNKDLQPGWTCGMIVIIFIMTIMLYQMVT